MKRLNKSGLFQNMALILAVMLSFREASFAAPVNRVITEASEPEIDEAFKQAVDKMAASCGGPVQSAEINAIVGRAFRKKAKPGTPQQEQQDEEGATSIDGSNVPKYVEFTGKKTSRMAK